MQVNNSIHGTVKRLLEETEGHYKRNLEISYYENSAKLQWKTNVGSFIYPKLINIEIFVTLENENES